MKKKYIYVFILIFSVFSCANIMTNGKWNIIHGKGIKGENLSFDFLFSNNDKDALLLGNEYSNGDLVNKRFNNFNLIIYSSTDSGYNWTGKVIGKGKFTSCSVKGNFVFAAYKTDSFSNKDSSSIGSTSIYFSKDFGKTWSNISRLNKFYVRNIFILSENEVYVICKEDNAGYWLLLNTKDQGLTWNKVADLPNDLYTPVLSNGNLYYLSHQDTSGITSLSLSTKVTRVINIMHLNTSVLSVISDTLYVSGLSDEIIRIYRYNLNKSQFEQIADIKEDKFPIQIHSVGDKLILLLGERNSLGTTYYVYSKKREDLQWEKNLVPSSYFEPFTFYKNFIWGYSYDDNFYVMDLASNL